MVLNISRRPLLAAAATITFGSAALGAYAQDCKVTIGAVGPFSGSAAAWGLAAKEGAEFAAATANAEGGLLMGKSRCQVTVAPFDSQYTASGGAAAANFLANMNVHATVGPVGSPETTGFRPVAARSGIVNFSSSYMRDVITPDFPYAFHALQGPLTWGPGLIKAANEAFGFNTVIIVAPNDQTGSDAGEQLKAMYSETGVDATSEYFQRGTSNFAAIVMRIMNVGPDAVEMSGMPPADASILVKQLLEAGYAGVFGALGGTGLSPLVEGAGGVENLTNVYWLETSPVDAPGIVRLREDYAKIMGKEAPENPLFPVFALAGEVILQGISQAGTDADGNKIAEALRSLTPESRYMGKAGWRGKSLYGINQQLTFPPGIGMIIDGQRKPTTVVEIAPE